MPTNYPGVPSAAADRVIPSVTNPVDGDPLTAASNNVAIQKLTDEVAFLKRQVMQLGLGVDNVTPFANTLALAGPAATANTRAVSVAQGVGKGAGFQGMSSNDADSAGLAGVGSGLAPGGRFTAAGFNALEAVNGGLKFLPPTTGPAIDRATAIVDAVTRLNVFKSLALVSLFNNTPTFWASLNPLEAAFGYNIDTTKPVTGINGSTFTGISYHQKADAPGVCYAWQVDGNRDLVVSSGFATRTFGFPDGNVLFSVSAGTRAAPSLYVQSGGDFARFLVAVI